MQSNKNQYETLMQKLFQRQLNFEKAQNELNVLSEKYIHTVADNEAYKKNLYELIEKVDTFQKKHLEKISMLEDELNALKQEHENALKKIVSLEFNDENKQQVDTKKSILIIDKSAIVRAKTKKFLNDFHIVYVENDAEALTLMQKEKFDMIITDLDILNNGFLENISKQ